MEITKKQELILLTHPLNSKDYLQNQLNSYSHYSEDSDL